MKTQETSTPAELGAATGSASFDPKTTGDWLLPFRDEDNAAWRKANLFGRIFFPLYLLVAAWRTLMFWAMMLVMLPVFVFVGVSESKPSQAFGAWVERIFAAVFCKPNSD